MPIADDITTGVKESIDKGILKAAQVKAAPVVVTPGSAMVNPAPAGTDRPLFNPTASISGGAGRVNNDDWYRTLLGNVNNDLPVRGKRDFFGRNPERVNGLLGRTWGGYSDGDFQDAPGNFGEPAWALDNPNVDVGWGPDGPYKVKQQKYEVKMEPLIGLGPKGLQGGQKIRGFADMGPGLPATGEQTDLAAELGMATGALTTVPEVEKESTGVPAWDARIEAALSGQNMYAASEGSTPGMGSRAGSTIDATARAAQEADNARQREESAGRSLDKALGREDRSPSVLGAKGYKKLDGDQKAAVDFNTLLSEARQNDRALNRADKAGKVQMKPDSDYASSVAAVFGDDENTVKYAPATVALLSSIGFKAGDIDLNDFLKLKVGVNAGELDSFSLKQNGSADASLVTPESTRSNLQKDLVEAFRNTRTDQVAGGNLLGLQESLLGADKMLGFGQGDDSAGADYGPLMNSRFQKGLLALAQPKYAADKDQIIGQVKAAFTDQEWDAFVNFLDVKSREAMQYKRPLSDAVDSTTGEPLEFMLARDFRKHMGF